ncbi:MAG: 16S rRNA (cytosine(967)-C(5))-methyltransferase [[Chlorobium] sp. 445]|nr:MAG: 16S rRNA (cytosine(967)-C(5))-methyltransferase [[Chlorobium] sp. 445]
MTAREIAVKVLKDVETGKAKSDTIINNYFNQSSLERLDKAFAMEMVYGTLRERAKIDHIIQQFYNHDYQKMDVDIRNILRIGVYQLFYLTKVPKWAAVNESVELAKKLKNQFLGNLVNGVLRNISNNIETINFKVKGGTFADQIALQYSHPKWLLARWLTRFSLQEAQDLMSANNTPPTISFRINPLKTTLAEVEQMLSEKQVHYKKSLLENFLIPEKFFDMEELLKMGYASVQSEAQAIACMLLGAKPGDQILDMCAAPGGKSTFLAEQMRNTGKILALDLYGNKLQDISRLATTLGISIIETAKQDARLFQTEEKFDRVLLDAPCSGTGVLSRRAELRWRLSPNDITTLAKTQRELLNNATRLVKDEGIIVYSTCSIEPEENQQLVNAFLYDRPDWMIQDAREVLPTALHHLVNPQGAVEILPHIHHLDGAYAVRFIRR